MKPPFVPIGVGGTRVVPSGLVIESVIGSRTPNVTLPTLRLIRCPVEPSKTRLAFASGGGGHGQGEPSRVIG